MYCNNCGKKIKESSKFCNFCGHKIIVSNFKKSKKTDKTDYVWACDYCGKEFETKLKSDNHEKICKKNPINIKNTCVSCGTENKKEAKFCKKCGQGVLIKKTNFLMKILNLEHKKSFFVSLLWCVSIFILVVPLHAFFGGEDDYVSYWINGLSSLIFVSSIMVLRRWQLNSKSL